jgi:hypothetical protein
MSGCRISLSAETLVFPQLPVWTVHPAATHGAAADDSTAVAAGGSAGRDTGWLSAVAVSCLQRLNQPTPLVSRLASLVAHTGGHLHLVAGPTLDVENRPGWELRMAVVFPEPSGPQRFTPVWQSVVSSRVGRQDRLRNQWLDDLYRTVVGLPLDGCLLSVSGTATAPFVEAAAALPGTRLVRIESSGPPSPAGWLRRTIRRLRPVSASAADARRSHGSSGCASTTGRVVRIDLSPSFECWSAGGVQIRRGPWLHGTDCDWIQMVWAQRSTVLRCQAGGTIERIVQALGRLRIGSSEASVPLPEVVDSRRLGAGLWNMAREDRRGKDQSTKDRDRGERAHCQAVAGPPGQTHGPGRARGRPADQQWARDVARRLPAPWSRRGCLIHWTRGNAGPYPDETEDAFLLSLLVDRKARCRSPLDVLLRIGRQMRLLGSALAVGGGRAVVCLSEIDPAGSLPRPVWRRHRCRWDALPFGIGIDREELSRRGAEPVRYVEPAELESIPPADRWRFQPAMSQAGSGRIDWRCEREWRWPGTLDLRSLPPGCWFAFAPSQAAVRELATVFGRRVLCLVPEESS